MQKSKTQSFSIDHIGIEHILFDHGEWVTLWGFMLIDGKKVNRDYLIGFEQLNELLRLSGEEGEAIQMLLVEKIENGIEEPSVIHLQDAIGHPAFFNRCILKISPTWSKNNEGKKSKANCLFIDAVYPPVVNKPVNLSKHAQLRQSLIDCETELANAYRLYLDYLEIDIKESAALQMSGLEDNLKFKMAYFAWKLS